MRLHSIENPCARCRIASQLSETTNGAMTEKSDYSISVRKKEPTQMLEKKRIYRYLRRTKQVCSYVKYTPVSKSL